MILQVRDGGSDMGWVPPPQDASDKQDDGSHVKDQEYLFATYLAGGGYTQDILLMEEIRLTTWHT